MNRQQRRAMEHQLSKKTGLDPQRVIESARILKNILNIIDSSTFQGAKNAPLIIEAYQYVQLLLNTLPETSNEPVTESTEPTAEVTPSVDVAPEAVPAA